MLSFSDVFPANILAFQSGHSVDYSLKSENDLNEEQQEALISTLETSVTVYNIRQVHGDRIVFASRESGTGLDELEEADGVLSDEADLAIAVRTADCLPVYLYDSQHNAIGMFHCGWRSTQKHILKKALELMQKYYQTKPSDLKVSFGPALRSCHYEVGKEFLESFPDDVEKRDGKFYFDLVNANRAQLIKEGVKEDHIYDCQVCTYCDTNCFSHRKEGENAGRMLSLMMIKSE